MVYNDKRESIKKDLKFSNMSTWEIARKYNVSESDVLEIMDSI